MSLDQVNRPPSNIATTKQFLSERLFFNYFNYQLIIKSGYLYIAT
jgi:hypothetical protein